MKKLITILLLLSIAMSLCFAQERNDIKSPQTLTELQDSIQKILIETNTPGAGIVMVSGDDVVLLKGLGKADLENNIDVNQNTMFRLGSVSKLFVGLAVLKLQEEGCLNLKDKVKDIIPEIEIKNPWDDQHPIRIENLLEHTSGIGDWSLAELGSNDPTPKTLKESLEYYPKGRVAKFVPGTRMQYSNLAVSIAAYIVEKASGMNYEDYVTMSFFKPMGMVNTTFRNSDEYKKTGAKGYSEGIEMSYLNILYRPSAALTSSPKELVNMLKLFINRGKVDSVQLISDSSLQRMERNESLQIEHSEVFKGEGLTNSASYYKNFVYRGHGGSVPGSNSDFCYLPKYKLGYAVMINGNNQDVINRISHLVKVYQTKDLPHEVFAPKNTIGKSTHNLTGYYIPVNYKFDVLKFFLKIKGMRKIWHHNDTLCVQPVLNNYTLRFHPNNNNEFVSEVSDRYVLFKTNDAVEGDVIYGSMGMLKRISPLYAYTFLTIFFALFIIPVTVILFALLRLLIYLFGKKKDKVALWICLWPFVAISFVITVALVLIMTIHTTLDVFLLLGNISLPSLTIFIGTICFALASLWSVYYIYKNRHIKMSRVFYYHSLLAAVFNVIFTIYFFSNGLIGIMTWI